MPVHLHLNEKVKPKYHKPRKVPFSLKKKVDKELDRLQGDGIISPVKFSKCAAPVVPVLKRDGTVQVYSSYGIIMSAEMGISSFSLPVQYRVQGRKSPLSC